MHLAHFRIPVTVLGLALLASTAAVPTFAKQPATLQAAKPLFMAQTLIAAPDSSAAAAGGDTTNTVPVSAEDGTVLTVPVSAPTTDPSDAASEGHNTNTSSLPFSTGIDTVSGAKNLNTKYYQYIEPKQLFFANVTLLEADGIVGWTVCNPASCSQPTIIDANYSVTVPHGRYLVDSKLYPYSYIQVFNHNGSKYGDIKGAGGSCIYAADAVSYCGGASNLHMTPQRQVTMRHVELIRIDSYNGNTTWKGWSFDHTWG